MTDVKNKKIYINGYEILVSRDADIDGKHTGEGLLYMPLLRMRLAVEWQSATIVEGDDGTHGCLYPEARAIGNVNGVVGADYKKQIVDLLTSGPHEFSGTFGEALKEMSAKGTDIKNGQTIDKPKTASVIGAVNKGIADWSTTLQSYFPATNRPAEVTQILANLTTYTQQLATIQTCLAPTPPPATPAPSGTANALPTSNKTKQPNTSVDKLAEQKLDKSTDNQNIVASSSSSSACEPSEEDGELLEKLLEIIEDKSGEIEILEIEELIKDPLKIDIEKVTEKAVELSKKYYVNEKGELARYKLGKKIVLGYLGRVFGMTVTLTMTTFEIGKDPYDDPDYRNMVADEFLDSRHPNNDFGYVTDVAPDIKGRRRFVSYIKVHKENSSIIYSGRTSGPQLLSDQQIVDIRDRYHHMNDVFGPAIAFKGSYIKFAVRGLEQQMIDYYGCAQSDGGVSGNRIRGVSKLNPRCMIYHLSSNTEFLTELHHETCIQNCK